jgi:hypothetical protein
VQIADHLRRLPSVLVAARYMTLAIVIVLALAITVKWVYTVPIFQNPDEPIHTDYAFALMDVGHPMQVSPIPQLSYVDPLTGYLDGALATGKIAFAPHAIVQPAYGTPEMFAALDRNVPLADEQRYREAPMPTRLRYPIAYYGLIAVVGGTVRGITHSLVGAFFAMRLVGVALLGITLVCGFVVLRASGLNWITATAITAIVGLLPEQAFLSASIQPDTLSEAAATATLMTAVLFKRSPSRVWLIATSLLFAVLFLTKIQYFVAVGIPVVLVFWALALRYRLSPGRLATLAVLFSVPTALAYAAHRWILAPASIVVVTPDSTIATRAAWHAAFHAGIGQAFLHLIGGFAAGFGSYFLDGAAARSYWGIFGWMDTPIALHSPAFTALVFHFIAGLTFVVMIAAALVGLRGFMRAVNRLQQRKFAVALAYIADEPLFLAIALFDLGMLGLWLWWGDFGYQGRYWLPLAFPTWYVAVKYAPAIIAKRVARMSIAAVFVIVPSLIAVSLETCYALPTVVHRFYHAEELALPNRGFNIASGTVPHAIDIAAVGGCVISARAQTTCPSGSLHLGGWAAIGGPIKEVVLYVDRTPYLSMSTGDRPDVAASLKLTYVHVGFDAVAPLAVGHHLIRLDYVATDGTTEFVSPERFDVIVTAN